MPSRRKKAPSFDSPPPPARKSAGWVYRSSGEPPSPPPPPRLPMPVTRVKMGFVERAVATAAVPFSVALMAAMVPFAWFRRQGDSR